MPIDTYDTSSKLNIAHDDLEKARFFKNTNNKIAVRVGNEESNPLYVTLTDDNNILEVDIIESDKADLVTKLVETLVAFYLVPPGKVFALDEILGAGENTARYTVKIDGQISKVKYTYYGATLNAEFNYKSLNINAGSLIQLFVEHFVNDTPCDFYGSIQGRLKNG